MQRENSPGYGLFRFRSAGIQGKYNVTCTALLRWLAGLPVDTLGSNQTAGYRLTGSVTKME